MSQFVASATTDQGTYALGEAVTVTVTLRDTSTEACNNSEVTVGGCPPATATVYDTASGLPVWQSGATSNGLPINCPAEVGVPTIPGGYTATDQVVWQQDDCTMGPPATTGTSPDCPQSQVTPGTYTIQSLWERWPAPPVSVEISP